MPRIEPLAAGIEPPEVERVFDQIRARGGQPSPLYRTLAHAPGLLGAWAEFAGALRSRTSLDRSLGELIVMRLAQLSNAPYQWAYHWKPALAAGLAESQLRSLESWRRSTEFDERQRKALGLAEAMYFGDVDDGQIELLHTIYDTRQILEIALTAGFYINVGRILQALQPEIDPSRRAYLP